MKMAIDLSIEGIKKGSASFGAVIVKDGKVIGKGYNTTVLSYDPTAHGEIVAIRDACKNLGTMSLGGCDLYTNADPCPMCFSAAYWAGIKNIYYGVTKEDLGSADIGIEIYRQVCLPYAERSIKMESVLREEANKVFKGYIKK
jgi:tRNA(Arg) A34 adenosine deaminase TadA